MEEKGKREGKEETNNIISESFWHNSTTEVIMNVKYVYIYIPKVIKMKGNFRRRRKSQPPFQRRHNNTYFYK